MSNYQLSIITPTEKIFEGQVEYLSAPGSEGSFGILGHHAPIVSSLKEGTLKIKQDGEEKKFAITTGILEVNCEGNVLVLSDSARKINETKITEKK